MTTLLRAAQAATGLPARLAFACLASALAFLVALAPVERSARQVVSLGAREPDGQKPSPVEGAA